MRQVLIVNLDDKNQGVALVSGVMYRVTGTYGLHGNMIYPPTSNRRKLTIELILNDTLDEEQQRKRIDRLEMQLQEEREHLEEIRRIAAGEEQSEDR